MPRTQASQDSTCTAQSIVKMPLYITHDKEVARMCDHIRLCMEEWLKATWGKLILVASPKGFVFVVNTWVSQILPGPSSVLVSLL